MQARSGAHEKQRYSSKITITLYKAFKCEKSPLNLCIHSNLLVRFIGIIRWHINLSQELPLLFFEAPEFGHQLLLVFLVLSVEVSSLTINFVLVVLEVTGKRIYIILR